MENWNTLKTSIASAIKTNGNQSITGQILQDTLNSIVNALGENATFAGIAQTTTNPGTPDGPVYYISSGRGVYTNFGGLEIKPGEIGTFIIWKNKAWHKSASLLSIAQSVGNYDSSVMSQKAVSEIINDLMTDIYEKTIFPGFVSGQSPASGSFTQWIGFSKENDMDEDGNLVGILFENAPAKDLECKYRISKKIKGTDGKITGLQVISDEITFILPAGKNLASVQQTEFKKDYVLEIYFNEYVTTEYGIKYTSGSAVKPYIRFNDGIPASNGSMYSINSVILSSKSMPKKNAEDIMSINSELDAISSEITICGKNLFDKSKVIEGYFVDTTSGKPDSAAYYPDSVCSPKIEVQANTYYSISGRTDTKGIAAYDSNDNPIKINGSYQLGNYNGSFLVPEGAKYIQFTCTLNDKSSIDKIQLEVGDEITEYEPFMKYSLNNKLSVMSKDTAKLSKDIQNVSASANASAKITSLLLQSSGTRSTTPNYVAYSPVSGLFTDWYGFSLESDLQGDYFLEKVIFSGSLETDYTFNIRVSKKVRDDNSKIIGLETVIKPFEVTLKAGESEVKLNNIIEFKKDYVLETQHPNNIKAGLVNYTSGAATGDVYVRYNNQVPTAGSMWDINAGLLQIDLSELTSSKKTIKILSVGNSFAEDAFSYVPFILRDCCKDIDLTFGILYYGGCSLSKHYDHFINESEVYVYRKITPKDNVWETPNSSATIQYAIDDEDWDVIIFQQNGSAAGNYDTFQPYLNSLIQGFYPLLKKPVRFGWHMVEPYDYDLQASVDRFATYVDATKKILDETVIDLVFPSATGMQNARTTPLQSLGDAGNLMHSSQHAQEGIPCYCLALPNVMLIAELCGNKACGIYGDRNIPTQTWVNSRGIPNQNGTSVGASTENCLIAQMCAIFAYKEPFTISEIPGYSS